MTAYTLPKSALVDKFLPKSVIFQKLDADYKIREDFSKYIQKLTWKYKLAENTIWVPKWEKIEEIQIFEVQLKIREIPVKLLTLIDKIIPYPILFECVFWDDVAYAIKYDKEYFVSQRNENITFELNWVNLDKVYEKIVAHFIDINSENTFEELLDWHQKIEKLQLEITKLTLMIKKEVQFNRKVPLNMELQKKKKELEYLLSHKNTN